MTIQQSEPAIELADPFPLSDCPMTLAFSSDSVMAGLICSTHRFVDAGTGKPLVNPDGSAAIIYASETTGLVRYYKRRNGRCYHVRASGHADLCRWRYRLLKFFGITEAVVVASETYEAAVRFVPIEGKERLAAQVRDLYRQREALRDAVYAE